jgi:hypothetical protein
MKIKTSSQEPTLTKKVKNKNDRKRLLIVFFSTFVGVLLLFTAIASLLTPDINIPAINNEDNIDSIDSNDFKQRIDPRLKMLEMQEQNDTTTETEKKSDTTDETKASDSNKNSATDNTEFPESPFGSSDSKNQEDTSSATDTTSIKDPFAPPEIPPKSKVPVGNALDNKNLLLRRKIEAPTPEINMNKVMVGSYSNPTDARMASQQISSANPDLTPFIRESNGIYSLQVGSFSSTEKAQELANRLRFQNKQIRIIKE